MIYITCKIELVWMRDKHEICTKQQNTPFNLCIFIYRHGWCSRECFVELWILHNAANLTGHALIEKL